MTEKNLRFWSQHDDIDPKFTKKITGKQYGGTSPDPQYVVKCLTEMFGPIGQGFGWEVIDDGFRDFHDNTVLHWCRIRFWWRDPAAPEADDVCSYEAYGQTKAAYASKNSGFIVDEDAPKKSLTDALTKAASWVGIAANIYLGLWDNEKYVQKVTEEKRGARPDEVANAVRDIKSCADEDSLIALSQVLKRDYSYLSKHPDIIAAAKQRMEELKAHAGDDGGQYAPGAR